MKEDNPLKRQLGNVGKESDPKKVKLLDQQTKLIKAACTVNIPFNSLQHSTFLEFYSSLDQNFKPATEYKINTKIIPNIINSNDEKVKNEISNFPARVC